MSPQLNLTAFCGALALLATGCSFDLSLPEKAQRGAASGSLELGGHVASDGGYTVSLVDAEGSAKTQVTDPAAAFQFSDLMPGQHYLEVKVPGFEKFVRPNIMVKPGQTVELGALKLEWLQGSASEGILTGFVGVTGGGTTASGGQVDFVLEGVNQRLAIAAIGADGSFVQRLPPGTYTLRASHPSFVTKLVTGISLSDAERKELSDPILLELNPAKVSGTVTKEVDGLAPVAAAGVTVTVGGGTTTTDQNGAFEVTGLAAGNAAVRFTLAGFNDPVVEHPVVLKPAQTTALGNTQLLLNRGSISGRVQLTDNSSVADVNVAVSGSAYTAVVSPDVADPSQGSFRISNVPVGTYAVIASRQRYSSATAPAVTVAANLTTPLAAPLILALLAGDFEVDDADPASLQGYVNKTALTIKINNVSNAAKYRVSEDSAFGDMPTFQNLSGNTINWTLTSSTEGLHTIYLQYQDTSGTSSPTLSTTIVLDTVKPTAALAINGGALYTNQLPAPQTLTVGISGSGTGSALHQMIVGEALGTDGGVQGVAQSYAPFSPFVRSSSADGVQLVRAQVMDQAGNLSTPFSASISVDTVAPAGAIAIRQGAAASVAGYTNEDLVLIDQSFGAESNLSIRTANSSAALQSAVLVPVQPVAGWRLDPSTEGSKTVYAQLWDPAGNSSSVLTDTIIYDVTPPSPVGLTVLSDAVAGDAGVTLQLTSPSEPLSATSAVTLSESLLFSGPTTPPPFAFPANSRAIFQVSTGNDGLKTIYGRFRDIAGNTSVAEASVVLDRVAPSGSIALTGTLGDGSASPDRTSTAAVTLSLNLQGATGYLLGNESLSSCPVTPASYLPLNGAASLAVSLSGSATPRVVRLCVRDDANHIVGPFEDTLLLDSTAPAGCVVSVEAPRGSAGYVSNGFTSSSTVRARFTGCSETPTELAIVESAAAVDCSAATVSWSAFADPTAVLLSSAQGSKTLRTCVRDATRNVATLAQRTVVLDSVAPSLVLSLTTATPTSGAQAVISVTATDSGGSGLGADALTGSEDPSFVSAVTGPTSNTTALTLPLSSGDGAKRLYVRARDGAGNETVDSVTITRDTSAPSGSSITVYGSLGDGAESATTTTTSAVSVALNATDATEYAFATGASCPTSGYSPLSGSRANTTLTGSGSTRTVSVCFRDAAGNAVGPITDTIGFDSTGPAGCVLSLEAQRDGQWTTAASTNSETIRGRFTGCAETPAEIVLGEGTLNCAAPTLAWRPFEDPSTFVVSASEATKAIRACVRDASRNAVALSAQSVILDKTAPTLSLTLTTASPTNGSTASVNVTAADTGGAGLGNDALTASEDAAFLSAAFGPAANASSLMAPLSSGDGQKRLYVRVRDAAGNERTSSVVIDRDTTRPTSGALTIYGRLGDTTTESSTHAASTNVEVQLSASDATEYALTTSASCPATGYATLPTGRVATTLSGAGATRTVSACFKDAAGNISLSPISDSIIFDNAAPTACTLTLEAQRAGVWTTNGFTSSTALRAKLSCTENPASIAAVIDGTCAASLSYVSFASTLDVTLPATQVSHTVTICARDAQLNSGAVGPVSIILDTTPPAISAAAISEGAATSASTVTVTSTASDAHGLSHADAYTVSEDVFFTASPIVGPRSHLASTPLALTAGDGAKSVYLRVRDLAGNESFQTLRVTRDSAPPTGSIVIWGQLADGTASDAFATPYLANPPTVSVLLSHDDATSYAVGSGSINCASASYAALGSNTLSATLSVSGSVGTVGVCLKDAAGNASAAITDTIAFESAGPSGCVLKLAGKMADGVNDAPSGFSAKPLVTATLSSCTDAAEFFLVNGTASCSASVSASWTSYSGSSASAPVLLSSGDGTNSVSGCVRTPGRNVTTLSPATISLDTTPPAALSLTINNGEAYINASQLTGGAIVASVDSVAVGATSWSLSESQAFSYAPYSGSTEQFTFPADGVRTLYARFTDALGNESNVITDSIDVDLTAPSVTSSVVSLVSPSNNLYLNNTSASVRTVAPSDAVSVQLVEDAAAPLCEAADFASAQLNAVATTYSFLLSSTEGTKRVCARWYDAAGNPSASVTDVKTLDTTPPSQPVILTSGRTFNPFAPGESVTQQVDILSTLDPQHFTWEIIGAQTSTWTVTTPASPGGGLLRFAFNLRTNSNANEGIPNVLQIRERDLAGNAGAEASVVMITDVVPPQPVALNNFWTDNASGAAVVRWLPSGSQDVVGHDIYYSAARGDAGVGSAYLPDGGARLPSNFGGFYANEGPSPFRVGNVDNATLSGLPNGSGSFVTVRPVDHAGNVGRSPANPPFDVELQPNVVSPNLILDVPIFQDAGLPGTIDVANVAISGHYAYAMASAFTGPCSNSQTALVAIDLSTIVSPVQSGEIQVNPGTPTLHPPVKVVDGQCAQAIPGAMAIEYPFLYTAAGAHFRVWSILNPTTPTLVSDLDLTASLGAAPNLGGLEVRGNNAILNSTSFLIHVDLSSLYDGSAATKPSLSNVVAIVGHSLTNGVGVHWTRDRALVTSTVMYPSYWNISPALDNNTFTTLSTGNQLSGTTNEVGFLRGRSAMSGNLLMMADRSSFRLWDVTDLWSSTLGYLSLVSQNYVSTETQFEVAGAEVFLGNNSVSGLQTLDLSDKTQVVSTGTIRALSGSTPSGLATYGNYVISTTKYSAAQGPSLRITETAIPRGLSTRKNFGTSAHRISIIPGFAIGSGGGIIDLLSPTGTPVYDPIASETWAYDGTVFDDTLVSAANNGVLRMTRLENGTDRSDLTAYWTSNPSPGNSTNFTLPAGYRPTAVEAVGNYLVVAEVRTTTTPHSYWIDVFRASGLRSNTGNFTRTLSAADRVAEYQFGSYPFTASSIWLDLNFTNGHAVVTANDGSTTGVGGWILDLRPMLDDNAATAMSAANVHGSIGGMRLFEAVLRGNRMYATGALNGTLDVGLFVFNTSEVYDGNGATQVTVADRIAYAPAPAANSLAVYGSYAIVTPFGFGSEGILSLDVSNPTAPRTIGFLPFTAPPGSSAPHYDGEFRAMRSTTVVAGSRLYVSTYDRFDIINLE